MEQLGSAAFAVALLGGVHDLLTKRIPNWLTFPGIVLGLAFQFWFEQWSGLGNGLLGVLVGFLVFVPIYATGFMGAGDVKLLMAIGAFMGYRHCLYVAWGSVLVGGLFALVEVSIRGRLFIVAKNGYSFVRALLVPGLEVEPLKVDHKRKFAFGICIAISVAIVLLLEHKGRLP